MDQDRERERDEVSQATGDAAIGAPLLADEAARVDDEAEEFTGEYDPADDNGEEHDDEPAAADDAVERLQGLVVFLASNLTDDPASVEVVSERRGQNVHLNLRVPEEELGKVIGRQGRIARAMRTALTIAGSRYNVRATLDIDD